MLTKKEKKLIKEFQKRMLERMELGNKKYGKRYLKVNKKRIKKEAEEEIIDFANYMLQIYMKLKNAKNI